MGLKKLLAWAWYVLDLSCGQFSFFLRSPFWVANRVRHPGKKGPKRGPNLENYPCRNLIKKPFGS